jgi:hypothetical protein
MKVVREQKNFASRPAKTHNADTWQDFQDAYGGWLEARGRINADHQTMTDEEVDALGDKEAECLRALWSRPADLAHQVFMKLEALEYYFDNSDWNNQRDMRMLASIKADLRELLP